VLELGQLIAGPFAGKMLADFGADVIKVEPPGGGDPLRKWRMLKDGTSVWWQVQSRNKRSIALDLRASEGQELCRRLAVEADVIIENFKPGTLEGWGLGHEELSRDNPGLVMLRISGFGQDGPYRHKPGFGTLVEGYSGFAAINGFEDREPVLPPMFMGDAYAGLYGSAAAMIALRHAEATGQGQVIDVSLFEPLFSVLEPQVANWRLTRKRKPRTGSRSTNTSPRNAYRTKDGGWVCLSASTQGMTEKLLRSIGQEALITDPRFANNPARVQNWQELDAIIGGFIAERDLAENLAHFGKAGVTIGPIMDTEMLDSDPYAIEREALIEVPDADMPGGWLPMHGMVPRLSGTPGILARPAPRLGEHNAEILEPALGAAQFQKLRDGGVIRG
jgi:formyl-CoA transferase